jgi:concanavalin A-like lectin/glucanase superfamily protein
MHRVSRRLLQFPLRFLVLLAGLGLMGLPARVSAQPFGAWAIFSESTGNYISIPHAAALNPTSAITIEAWISLNSPLPTPTSCWSIFGKDFLTSYWVGVCGTTLRTYLAGNTTFFDAGAIPTNQWTHIAVTYDGANRRHYINGELAGVLPETGALPVNTAALRIGSDVSFDVQRNSNIDEVRLWNVARSVDQIRGSINVPINAAQTGLVAVWSLDGNGNDALGVYNGSIVGTVPFLTFPVTLNCGAGSATSACLNTRFAVSIQFRDPNTGVVGTGQVVGCPNPDSALFWFFASNAWEVMVKTINACALDNHYWAFSAATTNVFYRLNVTDVRAGVNKIYFNYPGPPAPAVTDTAAFATCP